ncbi:MAG: AEC family transporter [Gammaproteobacteria bacterium]|nr:AEC family transporter [Gammaproteobacteria bacterium]MCP5406885.1 AEC family transporter [Chromatiaceae bacterium]MCP5444903.1 AEC family transporter [Chromatiaceae bacterium]
MLSIINALIPVFLIILLGFGLKRTSLFDESAWTGFENLCYFVLFPVLLIKTLATAQLGSTEVLRFSLVLLFAICTMSLLMLVSFPLMHRFMGVSHAAFTSLLQGATRWHGFIALSVVGLLYGDPGVTYMAITMAVIIPPLNIINVAVLAKFGESKSDFRGVMRKLIRNPFILACLVGAMLNLTGIGLPVPFYEVFNILGGGALGLGLLTVGAGLQLSKVREHRALVLFGAMIRLLGMPLLMFSGARIFGIDGLPLVVAVLAGAVPTAASSYVLARQMGGDAALMANLITTQVLLAIVTLPTMMWLAGASGI